jgi:DNA polymerase III subunit delta'
MFDDFSDEEDYLDTEEGASPSSGLEASSSLKPPRETFQVIGHAAQEQMLLGLFRQGSLPHALIFSGPEGIGKASFAFRFARFLLKQGNGDNDQDSLFGDAPPVPISFDVAEDDPVFRKVAAGGHPDLLTIERPIDEKKGTQKAELNIETARKIAPFLRMTSSNGGWRVVIVDDAETMNRNAQNAILKILEEPPQKALLILICHRLGAMIPTIRSRCRTIHFQPLSNEAMIPLLKQGAGGYLGGEETALLAAMAEGSVGRALTLHEEGGLDQVRNILTLLNTWEKWDWVRIHQMADNLGRYGADKEYAAFTDMMDWIFQSLLLTKAVGPLKLPESLRSESLLKLLNHYSLEQWTGICDKLNAHFTAIDVGNLDKRQGVIGAFSLLG